MRLTDEQKDALEDSIGKRVIEFRDRSLEIAMDYATGKSRNPVKALEYRSLLNLNTEERDAINALLDETITDTIFSFFEMFEIYSETMKLLVTHENQVYNYFEVSEKIGAEISFMDEDGWISKFSKIGHKGL